MCKILLSINPQHVENIFNGTKKYEYRKTKCKNKVNKIVIYSTSPVMRVVGEADVEEVLEDSPNNIWERTKEYSGVEYKFFDKYFEGKERAIAYKLSNIKRYRKTKPLEFYGIDFAPQSFVYLEETY